MDCHLQTSRQIWSSDDNEPFVNDNVVVFGGVTTIVDLPVGSTMIKHTVVDVCGNANTCNRIGERC